MANHITLTDLDGDMLIIDKSGIVSCKLVYEREPEPLSELSLEEEMEKLERERREPPKPPKLTGRVYTTINLKGEKCNVNVIESVEKVMEKIKE